MSASEKKRRSPDPKIRSKRTRLSSLSGQLTAQSHFLNSSPTCAILEVCDGDSVHFIICEESVLALSPSKPAIGVHYNFTNLHPTALRLTTGKVKCFRSTENTTWHKVEGDIEVYQPPCYQVLTTIRGKVTEVNFDLGVLTLNNTVNVITSACAGIAQITLPQVGQTATLFNAHRVPIKEGNATFVMCVKSFLCVEGESTLQIPSVKLSVIRSALGGKIRDYRLILWLLDCSTFLKNSFSDEFLSLSEISMCGHKDFHLNILVMLTKFIIEKTKDVPEMCLLNEFLSSDHLTHCGSLKEVFIPIPLTNLSHLFLSNPPLPDKLDEEGSLRYWQYAIKKSSKDFLVGVLLFKHVSHRLMFTDAFSSIALVILPKEGQVLEAKDLTRLDRKVVVISEYNVVTETFVWPAGGNRGAVSRRTLRTLVVYLDHIHTLSSCSAGAGEVSPITSSRKGSLLKSYMSQYIFVHLKSSPMAPKQGRPARYHIMGSLLGTLTDEASTKSQRGSDSKPIFLALEGPLIASYPYVCANTVYEIRLPLPCDRGFFDKGLQLSILCGMQRMLPTTNCVTLPRSCEIHLVSSCDVPSSSLRFSDCYSIDQAIKEANIHELINIKGYIVERYHQDPRYDREKIDVKANGFGTPGCKVLALVLRDTPPESQTGSPATIYLSNWATLQFPISLVPGVKVVFNFVVKVIPRDEAKGGVYFRTSVLSSVEVLELRRTELCNVDKSKENLLGPRSLLSDVLEDNIPGCRWLSVSMINFTKVTFSVTCGSCKHIYENGCCPFTGCSSPVNPIFFSQASFMINDLGNVALVFVPHEVVRKLFHAHWETVTSVAQYTGRLEFNISQDVSELSLSDKVFSVFCKNIMDSERFHLLCRNFNNRKDCDKSFPTPALYAVDVYPVTSSVAIL
ncbi:hypothetical protein ONE63_003952 [Megalurothrips usitatus]|uniref:CST complex subunit CTC1 n=1 Tax=Megalurothrips usitatus TaxID=439358 RepID=A0AAV7XB85_9NEOP|nr:hypothetical protein ONE63_003952 [Megalurothrips usitatus]